MKFDIISDFGEGNLRIKNEGENSSLIQVVDEVEKPIINNDTIHRSVRLSELWSVLKDRDWNIVDRKTVDLDKEDYFVITSPGDRNLIPTEGGKKIRVVSEEIPENDILDFEKEYEEILKTMNKEVLFLSRSIEKSIDLMNKTITINLITPYSSIYTNFIDLTPYLGKILSVSQGNVNGIMYLDIKYTKEEEVFSYNTKLSILEDNKILDVLNNSNFDISIEIIDNRLQINPKNNNIEECIINSCSIVISYGK